MNQVKELVFTLVEIVAKLTWLLLVVTFFLFASWTVILLITWLTTSTADLAKCLWDYSTLTTECKNWE